jgi:hypothetical protein
VAGVVSLPRHGGDVDPGTIEFSAMSRWRAALEKKHGRGVAHMTLRVWRSLWTIMSGMKIAHGIDRRGMSGTELQILDTSGGQRSAR